MIKKIEFKTNRKIKERAIAYECIMRQNYNWAAGVKINKNEIVGKVNWHCNTLGNAFRVKKTGPFQILYYVEYYKRRTKTVFQCT